MSVDNNGVLFLGRKYDEVDLSRLEGLDENSDDGLEEELCCWGLDHDHHGLTSQVDNGYSPRFTLVGFLLADSGSYGCKEVTGLVMELRRRTREFRELFDIGAKVYIMNYQW